MKKLIPLLTAATLVLVGCSRNLDSATYTSANPVGKVVYGTVISARQVTVKDSDDANNNMAGTLGGGALGGIAGSSFGKGTGRGLATVGGAIAGAMIGSAVEGGLSTSTGTEYIVQLDSGQQTTSNVSKRDYRLGSSVSSDINQSIQLGNTASQAIAIVQQDQFMIAPGTRVAVIYSDDRPRITPLR